MKKILIFILALFFVGCSVSKLVFKKDYSQDQKEQAIRDVYNSLWMMEIDSTSMDEWMTFQGKHDEGFFIERVYLNVDKKTKWFFIYRTCYGPDTISYRYEIVMKTKDKQLLENF